VKNDKMKCYFLSKDNNEYFNSDLFGSILTFINSNPRRCKMKEYKDKLILTVDEVSSIDEAMHIFETMKSDKLATA